MRFVWAVVAFLAAAGLIGAGVMQLSQLRNPDTITSQIEVPDEELAYTVVDADVLKAYPGAQGVSVSGTDQEIFVSYGRTPDVQAWLSDTSYNHATLDDDAPASDDGRPAVSVEVVDASNEFEDTGDRVWWNPRAADVWIEEMTADGTFEKDFTLPDGMSVLLATDGTDPAPTDISITWTMGGTTAPWAGPLIAGGCLAILIGLILWIAGFVHMRRRRGPRRKGPNARRGGRGAALARTEIGATGSTASADARTRRIVALIALPVGAAVLAGCSPSAWPDFAADPTPTPTVEPTEAADSEMPAVSDAQAERIVADMAQVTEDANDNLDVEMGAKRLTGAALDVRKTAYEIRRDVDDWPLPQTVPDGPVSVLLPQANDGWPRTVLMVVGEEASDTPATILTATQESPWETYKVSYMGQVASSEFPELAPAWLGATLVPPDSSFLQVAPEDLASAYADVIGKRDESEYAELFDLESDPFFSALKAKRDETRTELSEAGGEDTAEARFGQRAGDEDPVALATFDSGAIIAVTLSDDESIRPTVDDGLIKLPDAPEIEHFVDETETETGLKTSYVNELFFSVPAKGSDEPIRLLGYSSALHGSELLPEPADGEDAEQ